MMKNNAPRIKDPLIFIPVIYTVLVFLSGLAVYIHSHYYWSGNHWILFGSQLERTLFHFSDQIVLICIMPPIIAAVILLYKQRWKHLILMLCCAAVCWFSVVTILMIVAD